MTDVNIATRQEWLEQRKRLLAEEKDLTRRLDATAAARRQLPWVPVEKDYVFDAESGEATLADLFGPHSQLIVYHFMFGPDWEEGCKSCSFWADNFNGIGPHLNARDIAFVAISRTPLDRILSFRKRMGWDFDWVSSYRNDFNADFHVSFGSDHKPDDPVYYNFQEGAIYPMDEAHGTSVFARELGGRVFHTYSTYGRGLDATNAAYRYIDLTPMGRNEPAEGNPMDWVRHHDRY